MVEPVIKSRTRWFISAYVASGALMISLLAWQLFETTPARWCVLAKQGSPELATGCVTILMRLLDLKDHVNIGLMVIAGMSVAALAALATGQRLSVNGPGGLSANVGAETTTVTDGESTVKIPTPPSNG